MTPETKEKLKEVEEAGYKIDQPDKLFRVTGPKGEPYGRYGSKAEAIKHAYRVMRGKQ